MESTRHIELLEDCIKRGADYYLIFRDKEDKIQIAYSHDWENKFKEEVFDKMKYLIAKDTVKKLDEKEASQQ